MNQENQFEKYQESLVDKVVKLTNQLIFSSTIFGVATLGTHRLWHETSKHKEQISNSVSLGGYYSLQLGIITLGFCVAIAGTYIVAKGVGKVIYEWNENHFNKNNK